MRNEKLEKWSYAHTAKGKRKKDSKMKYFIIFFLINFALVSSNYAHSKENCILVSVGKVGAFWSAIGTGAKTSAINLGYKVHERSVLGLEGIESMKKQEAVLDWNTRTLKCEGILLAPADFSIEEKIKELTAKGFKTVYVDRSDDNAHIIGSITTDNHAAGAFAAESMNQKMGSGKTVLVLKEIKGIKTTEERSNGFFDRAKQLGLSTIDAGYVGEIYGDIRIAAEKLLKKHPETDGIFSPNEIITYAVSKVIKELHKEGIIHIGFDINENIIKSIKDGELYAAIAQDPYNMGYEGVNILDMAFKGETKQRYVHSDFHLITNNNLNKTEIIKIVKDHGLNIPTGNR